MPCKITIRHGVLAPPPDVVTVTFEDLTPLQAGVLRGLLTNMLSIRHLVEAQHPDTLQELHEMVDNKDGDPLWPYYLSIRK